MLKTHDFQKSGQDDGQMFLIFIHFLFNTQNKAIIYLTTCDTTITHSNKNHQ